MRILNVDNQEIFEYDSSIGYLKEDKLFVAHHEAVNGVEEQGHEEVVAEYRDSNGEVYGRDVAWVVDIPAVKAKEAWDEYEDVLRYVLYTSEELAAIKAEKEKPTAEERIEALEGAILELVEVLLNG